MTVPLGPTWNPQVGKIVKELRAARYLQGYTLTQLAEKGGLARRSLLSWEIGEAQPLVHNLDMWAKALGYKLNIDIE